MDVNAVAVADDAPLLLDVKELATRLNMPVLWLRKATSENKIPGLRVGGKVLYDVAAVQAAIRYLATKSAEPPKARSPNQKPPVRPRKQAAQPAETAGA
jgi:excisionase family DNA binding protein